MIDQQPDVELDAGQLRDREPLDAFPECRAGDGERVDAVGLAAITAGAPAINRVATRTTRSP
jgi:hypothetical protein